MTGDDGTQRFLKGVNIERSVESDSQRDAVLRAVRVQLIEEPQPSLRKGRRYWSVDPAARGRRLRLVAGALVQLLLTDFAFLEGQARDLLMGIIHAAGDCLSQVFRCLSV